MGVEEHKKHALKNIGFAVVVVSDTRSKENDESGKMIMEMIKEASHRVEWYGIIKNDMNEIEKTAENLLSMEKIDAIIFSGGTGISSRDVTVEATMPLMEKILPGFGEMFRFLSMKEIGSAAIMSRAVAGVADKKAIFCLPGSKNAVKLAMDEIILKECGHILWEVRK